MWYLLIYWLQFEKFKKYISYYYFFIYNFIFFKFYIWRDFSFNFDKSFHKKKLTKFNAAICWRRERKRRRWRRREWNWRAARTFDGSARTETAHRTFSPLKHFTETRKTRRTHTVLPCVTNIVVYGNDVRVRGRNGRRKNTPRAARSADPADDCCTQNIVPSEKWQLGHCAA